MTTINAKDMLALIKSRRTVRKFDPNKKVNEQSLKRILQAGTWAPYGPYYPQGWKFIALREAQRDKAVAIITKSKTILKYIRALFEASPYGGEVESVEEHHWKEFARDFAKDLGGAPVVIVGLVPWDKSYSIRGHNLGSVWTAVQNMMLQTQTENLACGVVTFHSPTVEKELVRFLGYPEKDWMVAFVLNLGVAQESSKATNRKEGLFEIRG